MKLLKLRLINFKGQRDFTLETHGGDVTISGENGVGKTTVADAFFYLLFGKDSANRADFEIKTLGLDNKPLPGIDHTVEAELEADMGARLTLAKTYKETYVRKRGSAREEFSGHTTDYFINGVPVQQKEYQAKINDIAPEKQFRMLTDPTFFNVSLTWQERRKMLIDICGDIEDAEVIAATKGLEKLPEILGQHSLDEYRKILASRRKAINEELQQIPARIDEATRALPATIASDHAAKAREAEQKIQKLQERRATASSGGAIAEKTKQLRETEGGILEIKNRFKGQGNPERDAAIAAKREKEAAKAEAGFQVESIGRRIKNAQVELSQMDARLEQHRELYRKEAAITFTPGDTNCPSCGQALPEEKLQEAEAAFNTHRAGKLQGIQAVGKTKREERDNLAAQVEAWGKEQAEASARVQTLQSEIEAILIPAAATAKPVEDDPEFKELAALQLRLVEEIEQLKLGGKSDLDEIDHAIDAAKSDLQEANERIAAVRRREEGQTRINELTAKERQLAQDFENIEAELFLTEEFIRAKVSMLTDRINSRFALAQFKLFEEQVNGGLQEVCEAMYGGVPYGSLNHGARINVGLDIINVLQDALGLSSPIFIDNAESVTALLATRGQQIRLVVSAADQSLRVETTDRTEPKEVLFN